LTQFGRRQQGIITCTWCSNEH